MHHSGQMMDLAIDEDERMMNSDDIASFPSSCMECSLALHTALGIKLHREFHQNYATFIDKYEKV